MDILIRKPTEQELIKLDVKSWGIWEKYISEFPWEYGDKESCYILEGRATVSPNSGKPACFGKGDFVIFPKGLKCRWKIIEPIRKHYKFG